MRYQVVRADRKEGSFTPAGKTEQVKFDNVILHVIYVDVDGKKSVDRFKVKTNFLVNDGVDYKTLENKVIEISFNRYGNPDRITVIK